MPLRHRITFAMCRFARRLEHDRADFDGIASDLEAAPEAPH
ncbi:hypothetical protein [Bradyrhizobium sp. 138]|nr:hypothetical protein [Bradyrhizobium sp. 138]